MRANMPATSGTTSSTIVATSLNEDDDYWKDGMIEMVSGDANGDKRRVTASDQSSTNLTLDYSLSATPEVGDRFTVWQGCDKIKNICEAKFHNTVNFGGFHTIPQEIPEQVG